ncbi:hypothetical protein [Paenibacillus spongiae]|uniref:Glycosyltransferase n=1 Tax=Paenibacillus spongiae TaxID=2909671 RepID=A0ABY5S782_9BACL|nr:hypothetical protein [Paenibacillus spongiae]UVI29534.1 hypothetical protein L1F29_29635 [Paenibacillus spongiae]
MTDDSKTDIGRSRSAEAGLPAGGSLYDDILREEANWIARLQLESGCIPMYNEPLASHGGEYRVIPYFTHLALLGLLEQPEHSPVVRKYMDWYFSRLIRTATETAPAGAVFDHTVAADRLTFTATGDFDSTDSYASTFLNVLRKYAETTGDTAYLLERRSDIALIAGAMLATKQSDGLTWAKPSYRVKYLMDNAEVYEGLADMEWICSEVFGDRTEAAFYRHHKDEVAAGIQTGLWNESLQAYAYAKNEDGSLLEPEWGRFYPDATAQLFPIWTGMLPPESERARRLYASFNAHFPQWPQLNKRDSFPWALLAYTSAVMGDAERTVQFLESAQAAFIERGHPWPWYVMESGVTMLAAARMKRLSANTA